MLKLHPRRGFETWQDRSPHGSHQGVSARANTDTPKCTLKVHADCYLLFTQLANHLCAVWFGYFLITVFGSVNILKTNVTERLAFFFFFVIKLYFSYKNRNLF